MAFFASVSSGTIPTKAELTMATEIITVPCLSDNYAFVIGNSDTNEAAVVDVPEAAPINAVLQAKGWTLKTVLLTHHHDDHVMGLGALNGAENATIIGAAADANRLPPLTTQVREGDTFDVCGHEVQVIDVSGHTIGHVAFYAPSLRHAFTADSLMALGCGRLFEGTADQMWASLLKLRALPDDTTICSGHEYTETNARFALTIDPENMQLTSRATAIEAARRAGRPTVPSELLLEKHTNPFLRADDPQIKAHLGMQDASDAAVFAEIRARKDKF